MKRFLNILGLVIMMMGVPGEVHAITSDDLNAVVNNTVFYSDDGVECTLNPTTGAATAVNVTDDLPSGVTTDQKIAQTFILGFDTSTPKDVITDIVTKFHVGGIYLTGDTTGFDKAFFSTLDTAAGTPLTVASDEEGGEIKNFSYTSAFPSAKAMGALPVDQVTTIGKAVGTTLVSDGVTMDLAPVLDLDSGNEDKTKGSPTRNVIGAYERSFSNNPSTISDKAGAFAAGLTSAGIGITFKHFPGLGYSTGALGNDTDNAKVTSPDIATLKTRDLLPYKDLLATYPNATVMLSNENVAGLDANKPASVSRAVVKLLRSDMKFAGAITTDDLNVPSVIGQTGSIASAVSNALKAGVTMPLFSKMGTASTDKATAEKNVQAVIDAVKAAKVSDATINDDITKILALKKAAAVPTAVATAANGSCCDSVGQASTTGSPATPTPVTGNLGTVVIKDKDRATTNAQAIYQFFRDNGATAVGAAGITGNFIDESGTDSNAVSPSQFYGIEQWGGDRWDGPNGLQAFAADQGTTWQTLNTQLKFSLFELGLSKWTDKKGVSHTPPPWVTPGGPIIKDTSITDPKDAAMKFERAAEGCTPAERCGFDVRQRAAQEVYDALKNYIQPVQAPVRPIMPRKPQHHVLKQVLLQAVVVLVPAPPTNIPQASCPQSWWRHRGWTQPGHRARSVR